MSEKIETGNIGVTEHKTFEQAQIAAYAESANTGGFTFPVIKFRQGTRMFLSGAFQISFVVTRLASMSVVKGDSVMKASMAMNRPLDDRHAKVIAEYLRENIGKKYIMPPLTLNVQEHINLHTIETSSSFAAGYLAIPADVTLAITDGQHRVRGILNLLNELRSTNQEAYNKLAQDSIAVMITCEHERTQIHQDFADCSKTKALPSSLLSLYDTRNPANRLVYDLEQKCPLFTGRIDPTGKTLSKKSVHLFLANQLRQLIKHLLYKRNVSDSDFDRKAREDFGADTEYANHVKLYVDYVNHITNIIPVLKQISQLPTDTPERGQIPKLREAGWVCLTATGLNIIGSIGNELLTHFTKDWQKYADKLADIDWRRSAEIWQGNIISSGRMNTQTMPLKDAVDKVRNVIGLSDADYENKELFEK